MLNGWSFFKIHKSLDFHFHTKQYDILKYFGKINVSIEKFGTRNDRYRFEYYGGKFFNKEKAAQFCIANFIRGNRDFIYQSYEDSESEYLQWRKVQESITKVFSDDVFKVVNKINNEVDMYSVTPKGNLPPLMQMIKANFVTMETASILNKEHKSFLTEWVPLVYNDPYMSDLLLKIEKYTPFVKYDKQKILPIIKEHLK